mmetsp:Transcript_81436/g.143805  ORF Transcript_81436/g.143805 Transcript_81436/m.143805 type:complete len:280 (-) Transcript_81436:779-1618(-)
MAFSRAMPTWTFSLWKLSFLMPLAPPASFLKMASAVSFARANLNSPCAYLASSAFSRSPSLFASYLAIFAMVSASLLVEPAFFSNFLHSEVRMKSFGRTPSTEFSVVPCALMRSWQACSFESTAFTSASEALLDSFFTAASAASTRPSNSLSIGSAFACVSFFFSKRSWASLMDLSHSSFTLAFSAPQASSSFSMTFFNSSSRLEKSSAFTAFILFKTVLIWPTAFFSSARFLFSASCFCFFSSMSRFLSALIMKVESTGPSYGTFQPDVGGDLLVRLG